MKATYEGGHYSKSNFTFSFSASVISEDGIVLTKEIEDFKKMAPIYGKIPSDRLFTNVMIKDVEYKIVGWRSAARNYPVLLDRISDGAHFKFNARTVREAIEKEAK